jgi:hypothetical protein
MREVDFIFVAESTGTNVVSAGLDIWETTSGIRLNDHSYAKSRGMNLRGGYITARVKGSVATRSEKNYPTGAEIINGLQQCGDVKVHFGNSRSSLYLNWKEYEANPSYTDVLIKQVSKLAGGAFGDIIEGKTIAGMIWNYGELAQKTTGTIAGKTGVPSAASGVINFLAGKDTPMLFFIGNRKRVGEFENIRKKRRICSFDQIAGILAGSGIDDQGYKSLDGGDAEDGLGIVDNLFGSPST